VVRFARGCLGVVVVCWVGGRGLGWGPWSGLGGWSEGSCGHVGRGVRREIRVDISGGSKGLTVAVSICFSVMYDDNERKFSQWYSA